MNRIYEKLRTIEYFKGKLKLDDSKNCLTIVFNEFLWLEYIEGNYTSARDEGVISYRGTILDTHCHITEDEEAFEAIIEFATEDEVYIENTNFFSFCKLRTMSKERFEKKKERYMSKKDLRIYTANSIIKRSIE